MKVGDYIASKYFPKMTAKILELRDGNCAIITTGKHTYTVCLNHWMKIEEWSDAR